MPKYLKVTFNCYDLNPSVFYYRKDRTRNWEVLSEKGFEYTGFFTKHQFKTHSKVSSVEEVSEEEMNSIMLLRELVSD